MKFTGCGASSGAVISKAFILTREKKSFEENYQNGLENEMVERYQQAKDKAIADLNLVLKNFEEGDEHAGIFEAHIEMLEDEDIADEIVEMIRSEHKTPEYSVKAVFEEFIELLENSPDERMKERAVDLKDVRDKLISILTGANADPFKNLTEEVVLVAHDITPSDTATMPKDLIKGIVTETGGNTAHSAILARYYGIPACVGVGAVLSELKNGDSIAVDGYEGDVYTNPDSTVVELIKNKSQAFAEDLKLAEAMKDKECFTKDGTRISIGINVGSDADDEAYDFCDFVGLLRTEFLYMHSDHFPNEEEQFNAYKKVVENAKGKTVTLRTLDIGGDKQLSYYELPKEDNPFLGKRAIRLCLEQKEMFLTQLRAALRASEFGPLKIMVPMIGDLEDIADAKECLEEAKKQLDEKNISYDHDIKFGIMIEIPAIAVIADLAVDMVDFASIGTNDLCQYTCAADRMNGDVAKYYRSYSPAIIRLLEYVSKTFDAKNKPVSICGEMASELKGAEILVGLGYKMLSVNPGSLGAVKALLSKIEIKDARRKACEEGKMVY